MTKMRVALIAFCLAVAPLFGETGYKVQARYPSSGASGMHLYHVAK